MRKRMSIPAGCKIDEYCGECRKCAELDAWLRRGNRHRMRAEHYPSTGLGQSWRSVEEYLTKWAAPRAFIDWSMIGRWDW